MKFILFICSANKDRSKTAEDHFAAKCPNIHFESAGTNIKLCNQLGTNPVRIDLLEQAKHIIAMEEKHRIFIQSLTKSKIGNKISVLYIRDIYPYNDPNLIRLLEEKAELLF